jgi:hypothetical protein
VRLINLKDEDGIAAVAKVECELEESEDIELLEGLEMIEGGEIEDSEENSEITDQNTEV